MREDEDGEDDDDFMIHLFMIDDSWLMIYKHVKVV